MAVELEAIKAAAIDPAPIKERMAKAEEINRQVRANRTYKETEAKAAEYKKQADDLTKQIEAIDEDKEKQLKAAKFPVDGLSFDSEGVLYNGVPFGQASQAERIRVSVSIAAALNPKLRIALIRDGSLLDSESMKLLNELAAEKDMQIWIESVMDEKEPGCIFIEDGSAI
jgi:ATPase subunit of ABC transporter with duplicated ATPase domains